MVGLYFKTFYFVVVRTSDSENNYNWDKYSKIYIRKTVKITFCIFKSKTLQNVRFSFQLDK